MDKTNDASPLDSDNGGAIEEGAINNDNTHAIVQGVEKEQQVLDNNQKKKKKKDSDPFVAGALIQLTKPTAKARLLIRKYNRLLLFVVLFLF